MAAAKEPSATRRDSGGSVALASVVAAAVLRFPRVEIDFFFSQFPDSSPTRDEVAYGLVRNRLFNKICNVPGCGSKHALRLCSRCRCTWYCGVEHQKRDRDKHADWCGNPDVAQRDHGPMATIIAPAPVATAKLLRKRLFSAQPASSTCLAAAPETPSKQGLQPVPPATASTASTASSPSSSSAALGSAKSTTFFAEAPAALLSKVAPSVPPSTSLGPPSPLAELFASSTAAASAPTSTASPSASASASASLREAAFHACEPAHAGSSVSSVSSVSPSSGPPADDPSWSALAALTVYHYPSPLQAPALATDHKSELKSDHKSRAFESSRVSDQNSRLGNLFPLPMSMPMSVPFRAGAGAATVDSGSASLASSPPAVWVGVGLLYVLRSDTGEWVGSTNASHFSDGPISPTRPACSPPISAAVHSVANAPTTASFVAEGSKAEGSKAEGSKAEGSKEEGSVIAASVAPSCRPGDTTGQPPVVAKTIAELLGEDNLQDNCGVAGASARACEGGLIRARASNEANEAALDAHLGKSVYLARWLDESKLRDYLRRDDPALLKKLLPGARVGVVKARTGTLLEVQLEPAFRARFEARAQRSRRDRQLSPPSLVFP